DFMIVAGVAVDKATLNFDKLFSYKIPQRFESVIKVGSIVLVPFGRGDKLRVGIVLSLGESGEKERLKEIIDVKNQSAAITPFSLKLIEHLKETTFCTYYEAVKTVVPYGALYKIVGNTLQEQLTRHTEQIYSRLECENPVKLSEKQQNVYNYLSNSHKSIKQICDDCSVTKSVVDSLVKKGMVTASTQDKATTAYGDIAQTQQGINLSKEQQQVFDEIIGEDITKPHLLYGVTSSGKSCVFLKLIKHTVDRGGGAMLLVPEISLTPQMIQLVKEHFGEVVCVIHSRLSATERLLQYNMIASGRARVVVGTRSAVFSPIENLQLIIIDEEHEKTFVSESAPRYSAIRVASFMAKQQGARLVLASATPSIESYYLAQNGFYRLHKLTKRYNDMPMPKVEIIDMKLQAMAGDTAPVSNVIIRYLAENIRDKKQSIVLINRRGYSTVGICKECKETLQCDDCSVNLVKHKQQARLNCHYCGKSYPIIERCPKCGGEIRYTGYGTQKIEEYISLCLPTAKLLRMDADTTHANGSHAEMLSDFADKKYDILIGTQMVAKGLDFKDVSLVCVVGIDASLNQMSYNGNEHAFNLLTQVIGRAGRWSEGSKAVVQTYDGQNNIIKLAQSGDYERFYNGEIAYRKLNLYPPFCTMCIVAFTSERELQAARDASEFLEIIKKVSPSFKEVPLVVLGPAPFSVAMVSKIYRYRLILKCKNTPMFRSFLRQSVDEYLKNAENKSAIYINLNPTQE
ncbi:MAG: primosomal protein N', partial [Oscillospiraceae bacterium]